MNYASAENWKYMKYIISNIAAIMLFIPLFSMAQDAPVLTLDSIINRIDKQNVQLQSYGLRAEGFKYSAEASTAWMAPMVGVGTFMTPYPGQMIMDPGDKGSLMLQLEQDIPNPAKLRAKKEYIASQGKVENANRAITMNDYKAQAKLLYYGWLVALQRMKVLAETEKIMTTMKKIEEIRYPYNQSQLGSVFKAEARIEENRNMVRMYEGEIAKSRAWLNSLMNEKGDFQFSIDTTYIPAFIPQPTYDTSTLASQRKDVHKMDESIRSMQLNIKSMKLEKKPNFRIRYDHMYPLDAMMPNAFSVMGMISIPIAPWSSKMYKNEVKAMQFNVEAMQKERSAMLNETQGMLYGMQYEIQTMQQRTRSIGEKIIPSLQRAFDADFQTYQENKLPITTVIADWEALTMMKMNILDEKYKLYQMIVSYEKELYK